MKRKTEKEIESFLLKEIKKEGTLTTWYMNNFYENFCDFMNLDFEKILENPKKIRYQLNKMVEKGLFVSKSIGSGNGGRSEFGVAYLKNWFLAENFQKEDALAVNTDNAVHEQKGETNDK